MCFLSITYLYRSNCCQESASAYAYPDLQYIYIKIYTYIFSLDKSAQHTGAIMSYAKNSTASDRHQAARDFNHFVIFDELNLIACHDFEVGFAVDYWQVTHTLINFAPLVRSVQILCGGR